MMSKKVKKFLTNFGCVEKAFCKLFAEVGCLELVFITKTDDSKRLITGRLRYSATAIEA